MRNALGKIFPKLQNDLCHRPIIPPEVRMSRQRVIQDANLGNLVLAFFAEIHPLWVSDHAVENAKIKKKLQASSKTNAQFEWKLPSEYAAIWNLRLHQMVFLNTTRARNNVEDETETFCETKY